MGDHYVPRYYLRGFSDNSNDLWCFDKQDGRRFSTQVASLANETGFYSPEIEQYLANVVEGPANLVLKKVRSGRPIGSKDKETLSSYIACMFKRVPAGRDLAASFLPEVSQELGQKYDAELDAAALADPANAGLFMQRKAQVHELLDRFVAEKPKHAWLDSLPPSMTPMTVAALTQMNWRFLMPSREQSFFTCDNPVSISNGLGFPVSELTFPISSEIALLASWNSDTPDRSRVQVSSSVLAEVNRRTASKTTRFAYYRVDEPWVLRLICRSRWRYTALVGRV